MKVAQCEKIQGKNCANLTKNKGGFLHLHFINISVTIAITVNNTYTTQDEYYI